MSARMVCSDPEQVRQLAVRCTQAAGRIDTLARSPRHRLYAVGWDGQDAQTSQRDWEGRHTPVLTSVASALRSAGQTLLAEAQQQVDASLAGGGADFVARSTALSGALGLPFGERSLLLPSSDSAFSSPGSPIRRYAWRSRRPGQASGGMERVVDGSGSSGVIPYEYRASAAVEALVYAEASAELSRDGLTAQAGLGGREGVEGTLQMTTIVRLVQDAGITVSAEVPAGWSELSADGYVLIVGGALDAGTDTMVPVVQVTLRHASDADTVWQTLTTAAAQLPEADVAFEVRRPRGADMEAVLEVVHRSPVTGASQLSILRTVFSASRSEALSVVATCGGGASPEARDALRRIVASVEAAAPAGAAD